MKLFTLVPTSSNQSASESLPFTADSSSTAIEFLGDTTYTSRYTGLDNVTVTEEVPEPSNAVLLLTGFAAVGGVWQAAPGHHRLTLHEDDHDGSDPSNTNFVPGREDPR